MTPGLRVEWAAGIEAIDALAEPWRELESKVAERTVYATHDYVTSWYRGYGGTKYTGWGKPLAATVWREDELVGVAPFSACQATLGRVPVRRLDPAGFNLQAGELLLADGCPEALTALLASLASQRTWDVLVLNNLPLDSELTRSLQPAAHDLGLGWEMTDDYGYAVADLRAGYEAYAKERGSNFRKQAKRHAAKVARAGGWRLDRFDAGSDPALLPGYIERMYAVCNAGWRARERGLDEEHRHQPFYATLMQRFAARRMVDLSMLVIDGHDAAFSLALVERGVYFHTLIAYDEAMADYSPGSFLLQEVFQGLPARNIFFVVSHGDYEYKRRWASRIVAQRTAFVFSRTVRGHLSHLSKFELEHAWGRFRDRVHLGTPDRSAPVAGPPARV